MAISGCKKCPLCVIRFTYNLNSLFFMNFISILIFLC